MVEADIKNTLLIIPVYNCAVHISELFNKIFKISKRCQILCINDGSTDNSLDIIKEHKVRYIDYYENNGKGYALKVGLNYAKKNGFVYALTLDADLQHDPYVIKNFFRAQIHENADLVIGYRRYSIQNMPLPRIISNYLTTCIVSYITKNNILDSQSGYRLYKLEFFDEADIYSDRFQMETEILFNYYRSKIKTAFVEIPVVYNEEISNISHIRDILNFIKVCWKEIR